MNVKYATLIKINKFGTRDYQVDGTDEIITVDKEDNLKDTKIGEKVGLIYDTRFRKYIPSRIVSKSIIDQYPKIVKIDPRFGTQTVEMRGGAQTFIADKRSVLDAKVGDPVELIYYPYGAAYRGRPILVGESKVESKISKILSGESVRKVIEDAPKNPQLSRREILKGAFIEGWSEALRRDLRYEEIRNNYKNEVEEFLSKSDLESTSAQDAFFYGYRRGSSYTTNPTTSSDLIVHDWNKSSTKRKFQNY